MSSDVEADGYGDVYAKIAVTADTDALLHKLMHRGLERGAGHRYFARVLEVGAHRFEHLPFVLHGFDEYVLTDIRQPPADLVTSLPANCRFEAADVHDLHYERASFDRVVLTCVLHHLADPMTALAEVRRVVRPGGLVSILLPTDPGLSYRLVRRLTSLRRARHHGLLDQARLIHAREHRNHYTSLMVLVQHTFRDDVVRIRHLPLPLPAPDLNALTYIDVARQ